MREKAAVYVCDVCGKRFMENRLLRRHVATQHTRENHSVKCDSCEKIYCVSIKQFPKIELPEYQINQLEIQATGVCLKCK